MAEVELDIKQWGNNLGVRLPAAIAKAAKLHVDQRVRVSVEGRQVVITPVAADPLTLEQRLALYATACYGGEVMAAPREGAERW
ncbi:AbrB/MazE/SpoVT family DNA-binding domain-containing protein [Gemmatimonas sp.]|uniref:AbrB/MazE/SpoVT family DNA-binding domain-containing protein n=1 Tax=Gemmatimonas sp. TaxID=1962908 RepID=UPI0035670814